MARPCVHRRSIGGGAGSLEREGPGQSQSPSLCGGATVPLGRSLWPMRGSTPRSIHLRVMHRRAAGSQRPLDSIRSVRFDAHEAHVEGTRLLKEGGSEVTAATAPLGGTWGTVEWVEGGIRRPHALRGPGTLVHSPRASRSFDSSPAAGPQPAMPHPATDRRLVKKCNAILYSFHSRHRVSLHGRRAAAPHRGSISPASVFPCSGTAAPPSGHALRGVGPSWRQPRCGHACVSHVSAG